jgi:hypothetical protein
MSRRRYISTDISTDIKTAELAEYGTLPLLLYTWAIPHMDDWGRMTGDARQFKLLVCPALDVSSKDVDEAINQISSVGLWIRYEVDGKNVISIPDDSWFKHQSYINKAKRGDDSGSNYPKIPTNTEEHRGLPQNTASLSPTPSFSFTPSPSPTQEGVSDDFQSKIREWLITYKVACKGTYQLESVLSFIGTMDIEVIEHCFKISENKHVPFLETVLQRHLTEGKTTKESIKVVRTGPGEREAEIQQRMADERKNNVVEMTFKPDPVLDKAVGQND